MTDVPMPDATAMSVDDVLATDLGQYLVRQQNWARRVSRAIERGVSGAIAPYEVWDVIADVATEAQRDPYKDDFATGFNLGLWLDCLGPGWPVKPTEGASS